jgi:hypothetical protein
MKPSQAELGIGASAACDPAQYCVAKALGGRSAEATGTQIASLDRVAKPAGYRSVFLDRDCHIALHTE